MTVSNFLAITPFAVFGALVAYGIFCDFRRAMSDPADGWVFLSVVCVEEPSDEDVEWLAGIGAEW